MTQQRCEQGADWVVRSLERESVDFPWEVSAALHVSIPNARHNTPPVYANAPLDKSLYSVVFTVLGHAFGVTHSRHHTSPATATKHRNGYRFGWQCDISVNESTFYWVVDKIEETVSESHLTYKSKDRNTYARSCHKWFFSDKLMQRVLRIIKSVDEKFTIIDDNR